MKRVDSHPKRKSAGASKSGPVSPLADWACSHPIYDVVLNWLLTRIFALSDPALFLIIGPTGVGKSTLIAHLIRELTLRLTKDMQEDPSRLATVYAEAVYVPARGFDWENLFTDFLISADEILVDRKVAKVWPPERASLKGLAQATNNMLLHHAPAVAIVDEGGEFLEAASEESLMRSLDYLKSLANRSRTHIAIFGDYRLAKMVHFSGQLNRRCHILHFLPYGEKHIDIFGRIVAAFERRLRSKQIAANLIGEAELLFCKSCGCVGLLKGWLEEAWLESDCGARPIDRSVLERKAPPQGSILKWRGEIAEGHDAIRDFEGENVVNIG